MANKIKNSFDVAMVETLNGGDFQMVGNDLGLVYSHENQVYLALFGGNVEESTPLVPQQNERKDYWANRLLFNNNPAHQFNSKTERTLNTTALSSAGRLIIENAVREDLKYLQDLAEVTVEVTLPKINTVQITIRTEYKTGVRILTEISFLRRTLLGDFSQLDFNSDFY